MCQLIQYQPWHLNNVIDTVASPGTTFWEQFYTKGIGNYNLNVGFSEFKAKEELVISVAQLNKKLKIKRNVTKC